LLTNAESANESKTTSPGFVAMIWAKVAVGASSVPEKTTMRVSDMADHHIEELDPR
jgi:hypothetical protein